MSNSFTSFLLEEYERRRMKNPRYSLRAFSRSLDLSSGRLSELLSGKRKPTKFIVEKISDRLLLSPRMKQNFLEGDENKYSGLSEDVFKLIGDWYHFALLALMKTKSFRNDSKWIGERLKLPALVVESALERLLRLGLIGQEKAKLKVSKENLTTTHDIPSAAIRLSHKQSLEQAIEALENVPVEFRDFTSMTMAISKTNLPKAKKALMKFRREITELLERGPKDEVYKICIQLFPLTQLEKETKERL